MLYPAPRAQIGNSASPAATAHHGAFTDLMSEAPSMEVGPNPRLPRASSRVSRVESTDDVRKPLRDHPPLHLERRRQLAGLLGQLVIEQRELLDPLERREIGV